MVDRTKKTKSISTKIETLIRFQYIENSINAMKIKAWIKVTDPNVNSNNALAYLVTRYPERQNIEILEIATRNLK